VSDHLVFTVPRGHLFIRLIVSELICFLKELGDVLDLVEVHGNTVLIVDHGRYLFLVDHFRADTATCYFMFHAEEMLHSVVVELTELQA
jgi:hypothetical protein